MYKRQYEYRRILQVWIIAMLFLMLYTTVFGRNPQASASLHLTPFWSIGAIRDGYIETLYEKIYNVLFFIPYGVLLGLRSSKGLKGSKGSRSSRCSKGAVLIGFQTSVGIELLQLITRTGTCETDDVICNTLGCAVGAGMVYGCVRLFKQIKR